MMRWWWFGPAVTHARLEREMQLMKDGGIGGFEVQPVYPVALDEPGSGRRTLPFLSAEFLEALRFTGKKAHELGLRMDLTLGSGWPYGGPQVSISQAAGKLRVEKLAVPGGSLRIPLPALSAGESLIAAFEARPSGESLRADSVREVTELRDGAAWLSAEPDERVLLVFIASRTGMMVKRPALGAEGFVLDHYDRGALESYLERVGDPLLKALGDQPPYAIFCDSLEVFGSDWTADFLEEFRRRRGYDLKPQLPALVADLGPQTPAVRHDWGRTLTELLDERFLKPLGAWAEARGTRLRLQGYGIPPATVASNSHAHLPEGEGHQWKRLTTARWAASASHVFGRQVTSSETWTWLHSPSFRATPLDLKMEADRHFLQGINQLIGHGWPYTPEGADYPGWRFYAAGAFNEKNPWWIAMPDVSRYLQRVSFLLRQGEPRNDVALYLPNSDAWAGFVPGRVHYLNEALSERLGPDVIASVLEAGFNFDFFDDDVLRRVGRVDRGALVLGPQRYRVVVLPNVQRIPLDTLRRLEEFARGGGVLVATRRLPDSAPGLQATAGEQEEVGSLVRELFGTPGGAAHLAEVEGTSLAPLLTRRLRPDLALQPAAPDIGFVHRHLPAADVYFLANTGSRPQRVQATFRVEKRRAEWWDPLTGAASPALVRGRKGEGATVELELPPYGSRVLVFDDDAPAARASVPRPPAVLDLSGGWRVQFGPSGREVALDALRSWTDDPQTRFFSGVATYEREITIPDQAGLQAWLELGEPRELAPVAGTRLQAWLEAPVREAAVVSVNGRRAGSVWCPPYALEVTELLRPGRNVLSVAVGNLAINHMAGRALPDYRLLNLRYGTRFEPQDMDKLQPVPSGLMGPVRLVTRPGPFLHAKSGEASRPRAVKPAERRNH
jgi:hypothetical protein